MYIEELKEEGEVVNREEKFCDDTCEGPLAVSDTKRALVGAGARALFYPTLLYNVVRNKIQTEFRWWDRVDEFILLGAVPFPADVPRLKALGVAGVVTLNESYETLVSTSLYLDHDINHLVIPTRDYLFAPSDGDIDRAIEFIHIHTFNACDVEGNASCGKTTYVHCKAGRGRSTTIVLCYLVKHKDMTPETAYDYVRSIRPRVLLAPSQWQAVQAYYTRVKNTDNDVCRDDNSSKMLDFPAQKEVAVFDDGSVVLVSECDLDGYDESVESDLTRNEVLVDLNLACRGVQVARQAAISRLSYLWLRYHSTKKLGSIGVDIHVY
ncbi:putative dual specificity protein phosphatase DSP8 isoform X1 [Solanum pennellii]|uniref:Dual specificity protein phosphatase DSP8 isoform X1 n=1 Tax=Solanum pennellii TaxID=28526 RepID=A0ABM1FEG0_SOLPN|nr:putative dual specificity protein phosphatase DSP8 isoform X1 [Solanum pennellii]